MIHEKGILKVWNSILDIEKDFKPCNVSTDDVDGFKEKEISKTNTLVKTLGMIDTIGFLTIFPSP